MTKLIGVKRSKVENSKAYLHCIPRSFFVDCLTLAKHSCPLIFCEDVHQSLSVHDISKVMSYHVVHVVLGDCCKHRKGSGTLGLNHSALHCVIC